MPPLYLRCEPESSHRQPIKPALVGYEALSYVLPGSTRTDVLFSVHPLSQEVSQLSAELDRGTLVIFGSFKKKIPQS